MKRIIAAIMALCIVGGTLPAVYSGAPESIIMASAEDEYTEATEGSLTYHVYADHAEVSKCDEEAEGEITIPDKFNGVPVTIISDFAFQYCYKLTSITIPDSVTKIGEFAFYCCLGFKSITIPDSVTSIGYSAFSGCSSLTSINIPDSVKSIGDSAFEGTPWLKSKQEENPMVIVNDILVDGSKCKGEVIIPDGVISIASHAFGDNDEITSVTMPDTVISIGYNAFSGCQNLKNVKLSEGLDKINVGMFGNCVNLETVDIGENIKEICTFAFNGCKSLKEIKIPEKTEIIGLCAFIYCDSIKDIVLPAKVKKIDALPEKDWYDIYGGFYAYGTFSEMKNLQTITIMNPELNLVVENNLDYEPRTISTAYDEENKRFYYNGLIRGYSNSTAQAYAEKCGYKFESIENAEKYKNLGKVNNDDKISVADAAEVLKECASLSKNIRTFSEEKKFNADLDFNDKITVNDASLVLRYSAYLAKGPKDAMSCKTWLASVNVLPDEEKK